MTVWIIEESPNPGIWNILQSRGFYKSEVRAAKAAKELERWHREMNSMNIRSQYRYRATPYQPATLVKDDPSPSATGDELHNEVEIGWGGGRVYARPFLRPMAVWTPEQAEQFAEHLVSAAREARKPSALSTKEPSE